MQTFPNIIGMTFDNGPTDLNIYWDHLVIKNYLPTRN